VQPSNLPSTLIVEAFKVMFNKEARSRYPTYNAYDKLDKLDKD